MLIIEIQLWAPQPVGPTPTVGPLGGMGGELQVNTKNVLNRSEWDPQSEPLPPVTGCENSVPQYPHLEKETMLNISSVGSKHKDKPRGDFSTGTATEEAPNTC